jgi:hypothetical protein
LCYCSSATRERESSANARLSVLTIHDDDDDDGDGGVEALSTGGGSLSSSTPSSSRARMLAQQRDLQLKKRQNFLSGGGHNTKPASSLLHYIASLTCVSGMVRSSRELGGAAAGPAAASPARDGQFTPAVRQFSAPKSLRESQE